MRFQEARPQGPPLFRAYVRPGPGSCASIRVSGRKPEPGRALADNPKESHVSSGRRLWTSTPQTPS